MEIFATIGPKTSTPSMIRKLYCAGVTVFRINLSYVDSVDEITNLIKIIRDETIAVRICLDTHGRKYCNEYMNIDLTLFDHNVIKNSKIKSEFIAISYTKNNFPILNIKKIYDDEPIHIIAKIEDGLGFKNREEIIKSADSILIDRGDLSRHFSIYEIPEICEEIINNCNKYRKPVFVATNLLESMVKSKTPTIGEVNDIASLLKLDINGLVLAAETALGDYPIECVMFIREMIEHYNGN